MVWRFAYLNHSTSLLCRHSFVIFWILNFFHWSHLADIITYIILRLSGKSKLYIDTFYSILYFVVIVYCFESLIQCRWRNAKSRTLLTFVYQCILYILHTNLIDDHIVCCTLHSDTHHLKLVSELTISCYSFNIKISIEFIHIRTSYIRHLVFPMICHIFYRYCVEYISRRTNLWNRKVLRLKFTLSKQQQKRQLVSVYHLYLKCISNGQNDCFSVRRWIKILQRLKCHGP